VPAGSYLIKVSAQWDADAARGQGSLPDNYLQRYTLSIR
jgi:hypothetical protein